MNVYLRKRRWGTGIDWIYLLGHRYQFKVSGRRGVAPVKEAPAVYGSGEFLYAYGTQANVNQVGLLQ